MLRPSRVVYLLFVIALEAPRVAWPQASTGTVSGDVRDQSGAMIPAASVTLTNKNTDIASKTTTNVAGFYLFPGVLPGPYLVSVEAPGMQKFEGSLTVQVQQSAVVDVSMKLGQTTTQVSVQDVTPLLQVDNPTLGHTLERTRIEQLPINGRDVTNLLLTVPGMEGTRAYGIRDSSYEVSLDGSAIADRYGVYASITFRQPGLDSIQEFKVETNSSSAKFTRPTSVIITTKNGTNALHGSAFETNRNNAVGLARSRTDYYTKPPFLNRNEFGVSAGGPVWIPRIYHGKNKTFWFFAYEGLRNINSSTMGFSLPTAAMRNGDMSGLTTSVGIPETIYNPFSTDPNTWSRQPFPNNQIPQNLESPLAKFLMNYTPLPTLASVNPNVAPNWYGPVATPVRSWTTSTRIDQRLTDNDRFYGRYTQGNYSNLSQFYGVPSLNSTKDPANTATQLAPNKSIAFSYVHTFSPTFFNELLLSGSRQYFWIGTGDPSINYDAELGLPNPLHTNQFPGLYNAGFPCCGAEGYAFESQNTTDYGTLFALLDDNFTKVHGKHEFQFGFHARYDQFNLLPGQQQVGGSDNWNTLATSLYDPSTSANNPQALPFTGDYLANFYLGVMNYSNQFIHGYYYTRSKEYASYFQDNYRVTPRLTLNLGLRWDYWPPFGEKNHVLTGFDPTNHAIILAQDLSTMEALGYTLPTIVNRFEQLGVKFETWNQAGVPRSLVTTPHADLGPRLGFAYRVGDGRRSFVVRGGYRISYFHVPLGPWTAREEYNAPLTARFNTSLTQAAYSPDGIANIGLRQVPTIFAGVNSTDSVVSLNNGSSLVAGSATVSYMAQNQPDPRVQDWNFTLEKEVMPNTLVRAGYIGNHSSNLEQLYRYNSPTPAYIWYVTTGQPLPTGPLANVATNYFDQVAYGNIERWQSSGWGNSNGVQLELERRYSKGYAFQLFYVLDNVLAAGGQGYGGTSIITEVNQYLPGQLPTDLDQRNRLLNYQRDTTIPHHRVRWNWVLDLPFGKGKPVLGNSKGLVNGIVGGWQVVGLGSLASTYFTLPSADFPSGTPVDIYGYKYPIQNCTSGTCYPGYLYYNGYIPSTQINSHNGAGQPNGYEGVPANYGAAMQPLIPYGATGLNLSVPGTVAAPAGTNVSSFWGTNTVWVPLQNGTIQRTTWSGLAPLRQQYFPGIWQWGLDASLVKNIPVKERVSFRFQCDFFNVLNHPGNQNNIGSTGILSTQFSGNSPRTLQLSGRLTW